MRSLARVVWCFGLLVAASTACSGEYWPHASAEHREASPRPAPALSRVVSVTAPDPARAPASTAEPEPAAELAAASEGSAPEAVREEPVTAPAPLEREPEPILIARSREVFVYERPSFASKKLGYLRTGARVQRSAEPAGFEGCNQGFYRVRPAGYVCTGSGATLDTNDRLGALARLGPDRTTALPYVYARARSSTPPLYVKLPSAPEQRELEPDLALGGAARAPSFGDVESAPLPDFLASGGKLPTPFGHGQSASVASGRALRDSGVALLAVYDHGSRRFGLTAGIQLVPLDRLERVVPSSFHGLSLENTGLPVAFVRSRSAVLYAGSPETGLSVARPLAYREAVPLAGERRQLGAARYLRTASGEWLRDERLVRVDAETALPRWAKAGKRWIHVSIARQALVAYEGERPVYVTLVSTGIDGAGDPETTKSTLTGQFLVHTKHVSTAMTGDEAGDEYDLEVPYVQYFSEGYALHAAYWHDAFGTPRSHGCVNLSPIDARWLFHWTEPAVPQLWHGAFSLLGGTLVHITP